MYLVILVQSISICYLDLFNVFGYVDHRNTIVLKRIKVANYVEFYCFQLIFIFFVFI